MPKISFLNIKKSDYFVPQKQYFKTIRIAPKEEVDNFVIGFEKQISEAKSKNIFKNAKKLNPKVQRGLDLTIASVLFLPMSISTGVAAMLSKITNPKLHVFHKQTRIGQYGKPFTIYKIRTVQRSADGWRILSEYTKFLRKYSIDEFPQLLNVIKGEMSFMGPRPVVYLELMDKKQQVGNDFIIKRCMLKPGFGFGYEKGRKTLKPLNEMEEELFQNHGIVSYLKTLKNITNGNTVISAKGGALCL